MPLTVFRVDTMALTVSFVVAILALVIIYDLWTLFKRGVQTTISYVAWQAGLKSHLLPMLTAFVFGGLLAHFWWQACVCVVPHG